MKHDPIALFRETCEITAAGCYYLPDRKRCNLPQEEYSSAVYIPPEDSALMLGESVEGLPRRSERCDFCVSGKDSFAAAQELVGSRDYQNAGTSRVLVLNFANPVRPGGGVQYGARAQEEDLCRKSTLYASLAGEAARPYYAGHSVSNSPLSSHAMLLSPHVAIFRDGENELLPRPVMAAVLTCAAPIARESRGISDADYEALLLERIRRMLAVAAHYRYTHMVLGAWGCGAFGNDARQMAKLFEQAFREPRRDVGRTADLFHAVVFAVRSRQDAPTYNYTAFAERFSDFYRGEDAAKTERTVKRPFEAYRDRIRGSLFGGAVGDALGYPVEFLSLSGIRTRFGEDGIRAYELHPKSGEARISDDTQMTLFTANGILYGETRGRTRGIMGPIEGYVHRAYKDWLRTQNRRFQPWSKEDRHACISWLLDIPALYSPRAPGGTCLSALHLKEGGSTSRSINNSCGCGGVMRVAPLGLRYPTADRQQRAVLDRTGAEIAALTHSHPLGWLPAALLTHIVNMGVYDDCSIRQAVEDALETVETLFSDRLSAQEYAPMRALLKEALRLSENGRPDAENIQTLGEGWTGDEALAIAVYCALRHSDDFSAAVIAAVNHGGDSDSTGAITGNIVGAWIGYDAIEEKWKTALELKDVLLEMADDLCKVCPLDEVHMDTDPVWLCKYVYGRQALTPEEAQEKLRAIR